MRGSGVQFPPAAPQNQWLVYKQYMVRLVQTYRPDRWTTVPYSVSPIPAFRAHEMLGSVASAVSAIQAPMVRGDSRLLEGAGCTRGII
jgi:hypothetical protein